MVMVGGGFHAHSSLPYPLGVLVSDGWKPPRPPRLWSITRTVATRSMIPEGGGLIVFVGFSPLRGIPGFAHASAGRAMTDWSESSAPSCSTSDRTCPGVISNGARGSAGPPGRGTISTPGRR